MADSAEKRIAVFIDAENISASYASTLFAEIAKRGKISFCRAYGDFSEDRMKTWEAVAKEYRISVFQQDSISNYKNAADIALVIGVMDIIHWQRAERFYIVSNDGDFTPLANRIKSAGYDVIGFGMAQASNPFRSACHDFIFLDSEKAPPQKPPMVTQTIVPVKSTTIPNMPKSSQQIPLQLRTEILRAIGKLAPDGEPISLAQVNAQVKLSISGFDYKKLGYPSFSKLLKSMDELELVNNNRQVHIAKSSPS